MTCEEFERAGWDAERDGSLTAEERAAAIEHAAHCSRCAALEDSWRAAKEELRAFAVATAAAEAPSRVEVRLRQEFRTRHWTQRARRAAMVASWGLAAAAIVFAAVTWINWRHSQRDLRTASIMAQPQPSDHGTQPERPATTLVADTAGDFTLLPGSMLSDSDAASIVRVRMQGSSLGALGFPVTEDRASEWIQVDLLVTDDGSPQGVRLSN
jgi:hypothetical protein